MPSFADWLKAERKKAGLSQVELAKKAKTSKQYINNLENDTPHPITAALPRPSVEKVDAIAQALNASLADARRAAGYTAPESSVSRQQLEEDELTALYFRHNRLSPQRKAEFKRILAMVDRELDRLEREDCM